MRTIYLLFVFYILSITLTGCLKKEEEEVKGVLSFSSTVGPGGVTKVIRAPSEVPVNSSVDREFFLINSGEVDIKGLNASTNQSEWIFKGGVFPGTGGTCSQSLKTGSVCKVIMTFSPVSAGVLRAELKIKFSAVDGAESQSVLTLEGTGVAQEISANPSEWSWSLSPEDGSKSNNHTPVITLTLAEDGIQVQMYDDSSCTNAVGLLKTISSNTANFNSITYSDSGVNDGSIGFYVKSTDLEGEVSDCVDTGLNYELDTVSPAAISPITIASQYHSDTSSSPEFTWTSPTDPAPSSGLETVEIGISTNNLEDETGLVTAEFTSVEIAATDHTYSSGLSLAECADMYVKIKTTDEAGNSEISVSGSSFKVDQTAPEAPVVTFGTDHNSSKSPTITVTTPSTDSCSFDQYQIAISKDINDDGELQVEEIGNQLSWKNIGAITSYQESGLGLLINQSYFVSIKSLDSAGNSSSMVHSTSWEVTTYSSCEDVRLAGSPSGYYNLEKQVGSGTYPVYCDQSTGEGGWARAIRTTGNNKDFGQTSSSIVSNYSSATASGEAVFETFKQVKGITKVMIKNGSSYSVYDIASTGNYTLLTALQYCSNQTEAVNNDTAWDGSRSIGYTSWFSGLRVAGNAYSAYGYFFLCGVNESSDNDQSALAFSKARGDNNGWGDSWRTCSQIDTLWSFFNGDYHTTAAYHIGNGYSLCGAGYKSGGAGTFEIYVK